jgi:hypothetical protein
MSDETTKLRRRSPLFILVLIAAPTVFLATCAAALYYALGKLDLDTLRMLACGSICIGPAVAILSLLGSWTFFNALHKKLDKTAESTLDRAERLFRIVGDGLGHAAVNRARVHTPPPAPPAAEPYWRPVIERGQILDGETLNLSRSTYRDE